MEDTMRRHAVAFALAFSLAPVYAQQPLSPPLKNWAAPLYWAATPAEARQFSTEQRIAHPDTSSLAQAASIFTPPGPMTLIAMTPCRVLDTRGAPYTPAGAFGPPSYPSLASGAGLSVPMPSSSNCSIPSLAGAYSLNITAISDGGGTLSSLSVWPVGQPYPGVSTLNDSVAGGVIANAAIVVAGTSGAIQMVAFSSAGTKTDVIIDINGYYADPTDALLNTGIGTGALASDAGGLYNTATGGDALANNSTGSYNTATGISALTSNTTGSNNTAFGLFAGLTSVPGNANTTGSGNTFIGSESGPGVFSGSNLQNATAIGANAVVSQSNALVLGSVNGVNGATSNVNVGIGTTTPLAPLTVGNLGNYRWDIGNGAGDFSLTNGAVGLSIGVATAGAGTGDVRMWPYSSLGTSTNRIIFSSGVVPFEGDIMSIDGLNDNVGIGTLTPGQALDVVGNIRASGCVIAHGSTIGGTCTSDTRFKKNIQYFPQVLDKLVQLKPASYDWRAKEFPEYHFSSERAFGLIAQEVEAEFPEMVSKDANGYKQVNYSELPYLMLQAIRELKATNDTQAETTRLLQTRLAALETMLSAKTVPEAK